MNDKTTAFEFDPLPGDAPATPAQDAQAQNQQRPKRGPRKGVKRATARQQAPKVETPPDSPIVAAVKALAALTLDEQKFAYELITALRKS